MTDNISFVCDMIKLDLYITLDYMRGYLNKISL